MHDNHHLLEARAKRTLIERIRPAQFTKLADVNVSAWNVTQDQTRPGQGEPVPFKDAKQATYEPVQIGQTWGPAWGTTWFKLEGSAPKTNQTVELHVDLGWEDHSPGFQSEGLVYTPDGQIVKAVNPRNTWIPLTAGEDFCFYIEAAANPLLLGIPPFEPTQLGRKTTSPAEHIYKLAGAQVVAVNDQVRGLAFDIEILSELAQTYSDDDALRLRFAQVVNQALDAVDLDDIKGSAPAARRVLEPVLADHASKHAHHLTAVGHAHIDSAWLWPVRETRRKVARTISNVLRLLDDGHEMIFALPAAQHVAWLEEDQPALFARLKKWVEKGKIVPVGGMWVEPDAMLPSGESLCRQLLLGQEYFQNKLGVRCDGVWLPDSFGYSAALPQIAKLGGAKWFLTQKISWNQTDVFPHHTLQWEGIDGTRLFTHFPPVDTYGAEISPEQVRHAETNFKDKAQASSSLLPYGYGDGGGGPTRDMLERAKRMEDLYGAPTIAHETPDTFFARAMAERQNVPVWVGELYLELHRGTLTSQANTKLGNRQAEAALREAELWATLAALEGRFEYPYEQLQKLWENTLLLQFHDILPGSSIGWVHEEAERDHAAVVAAAGKIAAEACAALADGQDLFFNAAAVPTQGVGAFAAGVPEHVAPTKLETVDGGWELSNDAVTVRIGADGLVESLRGADGREVVPPGERLGRLNLYQDFPNMWDAWDLDEFYKASERTLVADRVEARGDRVVAHYQTSKSSFTVTYALPEGEAALEVTVDANWQETEKLLKLQFPVDVHTDQAAYETQMGYLTRPINENTTWESNKFEVAAHRWVHVAETGFGVGIANEATYGWSHSRHVREGGGTYVTLGASLLRAAIYPDPIQDRGHHTRHFRVFPGAGLRDTVARTQRMNAPLRHITADAAADSAALNRECAVPTFIEAADGFVVETVKLAQDRSGDVIIRGYEPVGARVNARIQFDRPVTVSAVDVLESADTHVTLPSVVTENNETHFELAPFQIVTLRVKA